VELVGVPVGGGEEADRGGVSGAPLLGVVDGEEEGSTALRFLHLAGLGVACNLVKLELRVGRPWCVGGEQRRGRGEKRRRSGGD
jgi:hypothetical protein